MAEEETDTARKTKLVVFLHGIKPIFKQRQDHFGTALRQDMPDARIFKPQLPYKNYFCSQDTAGIAADIINRITEEYKKNGGYDDIVLIGHSAGGALARKVYVGAWGSNNCKVPFEDEGGFSNLTTEKDWVGKVSRIVLLAGITSGWSASGRQRWLEWLVLNTTGLIGHVLPFHLTLFDFRSGAPFIINTRLQWIGLGPKAAAVIQVLGSNDGIVAPDSSLEFDPVLDLDQQFYIVEVPRTDHVQLLNIAADGLPHKASTKARLEHNDRLMRRKRMQDVLLGPTRNSSPVTTLSVQPVAAIALDFETLGDARPPGGERDVSDVVFVIHGIRDDGFWTKKLATRIKQEAARTAGAKWRSITESYGYFTMLPFVFPWIRRQKVEWLMNIYAAARLHYPDARFHYVGHSNGTYLCAAAMNKYRGCFFERVVFAGSVVRPDYDWGRQYENSGLRAMMNYVATSDYVVALLPNSLRNLRKFDLGGAGHLDFSANGGSVKLLPMKFLKGGHGAGINEDRWGEIAAFLTSPEPEKVAKAAAADYLDSQGQFIRWVGALSPLTILFGVVFLLFFFLELLFAAVNLNFIPWLSAVLGLGRGLPLVGGDFAAASDAVRSLAEWWLKQPALARVSGLIGFVALFRFITTRY